MATIISITELPNDELSINDKGQYEGKPSVALYDLAGNVFMGEVYHVTANLVGVRLNEPVAGYAYCT